MLDSFKGMKVIRFAAVLLGFAGFLCIVRVIFILYHPITYSYGGREIDLPFENFRAIASGGPSINFFGGIRESMFLTVLDGSETVWEFSTEIYPKSINWRGSSIVFYDSENSISFYQGQQNLPFMNIMIMTPDIMDLSQIIEFKGRSEKISTSQNGRYEAFAMSDTDKMELVIRDSNHSLVWQCKMSHCSSVIDWQYCNIEWGDAGTVLFTHKPNESSYIKYFSMRTIPLLDLEKNESFF